MPGRSRASIFYLGLLSLCLMLSAPLCRAQESKTTPEPQIPFQDGPVVGKLGNIAEIRIPAGYQFTDKAGTLKLLELTHNPASGSEVGAIVPAVQGDEGVWFAIFEFDEVGYVKDDEKGKLDADAIFESLRSGTEQSNEVRKKRGWKPFHLTGWTKPPYYDEKTHNLTWSVRGRVEGGEKDSINYSTRILGRRGTMNVDLVLALLPEQVAKVVPEFENLLNGFSFTTGQKYSEFRSGDKIAAYGLTALVAGTAGALALKSGLLAKFWKLIVVGLAAIAGVIKKFFGYIKGLFSGKKENEPGSLPQG
jgi:uncharacterized membrane-anchored protein